MVTHGLPDAPLESQNLTWTSSSFYKGKGREGGVDTLLWVHECAGERGVGEGLSKDWGATNEAL